METPSKAAWAAEHHHQHQTTRLQVMSRGPQQCCFQTVITVVLLSCLQRTGEEIREEVRDRA